MALGSSWLLATSKPFNCIVLLLWCCLKSNLVLESKHSHCEAEVQIHQSQLRPSGSYPRAIGPTLLNMAAGLSSADVLQHPKARSSKSQTNIPPVPPHPASAAGLHRQDSSNDEACAGQRARGENGHRLLRLLGVFQPLGCSNLGPCAQPSRARASCEPLVALCSSWRDLDCNNMWHRLTVYTGK